MRGRRGGDRLLSARLIDDGVGRREEEEAEEAEEEGKFPATLNSRSKGRTQPPLPHPG